MMLREYAEPPSRDELEGRPLLLTYEIRPGSNMERVLEELKSDLQKTPHLRFLKEDLLVEVQPDTNTPPKSFGPTSLETAFRTIQLFEMQEMQDAVARDRRTHELTVRLVGTTDDMEQEEMGNESPHIATLVFEHIYDPPRP